MNEINVDRTTAVTKPLASILVPAYNEGPELSANLGTLARYLSETEAVWAYEIIVIDDGSVDGTYEEALASSSIYPAIRLVRHNENRGLGCAIRTGFAFAKGAVAVVFDSDLSYAPEIIPRLLLQMSQSADDLVLASPYMRGGKVTNVPLIRRLLSREANRFLSFATNGRYATLTCMVRAYRLDFFKTVSSIEQRMEINPELLFNALRNGARVSEIPARLSWSANRTKCRARVNPARTIKQVARTVRCGVKYRPAILLAIPGIMPGVLPLMLAIMFLLRLNLGTIATITLITIVIQNTSLALFAGQLAVFTRNVVRHGADAKRGC